MPEEAVFIKEVIENGRIVSYRFISTGSEAAEKWLMDMESLFSSWNNSRPLLLLIDLRQANNLVSAEFMKSAREASGERPDVPGRTAVVIDSSEPSQNVKMVLDRLLANTRERKLFTQEAEAIHWLLES